MNMFDNNFDCICRQRLTRWNGSTTTWTIPGSWRKPAHIQWRGSEATFCCLGSSPPPPFQHGASNHGYFHQQAAMKDALAHAIYPSLLCLSTSTYHAHQSNNSKALSNCFHFTERPRRILLSWKLFVANMLIWRLAFHLFPWKLWKFLFSGFNFLS